MIDLNKIRAWQPSCDLLDEELNPPGPSRRSSGHKPSQTPSQATPPRTGDKKRHRPVYASINSLTLWCCTCCKVLSNLHTPRTPGQGSHIVLGLFSLVFVSQGRFRAHRVKPSITTAFVPCTCVLSDGRGSRNGTPWGLDRWYPKPTMTMATAFLELASRICDTPSHILICKLKNKIQK